MPEPANTIELRAASEWRALGQRLVGHAAVFNTKADIGGGYTEIIRPGAFASTLRDKKDILALVDHNNSQLLGRTRNRTLRLEEDSKGLAFELDLPETTLGQDILALARRQDLGGMSFGFRVPARGEKWFEGVRELVAIDLFEISVVHAHPAYQSTDVSARSREHSEKQARLAVWRARIL